MYGVSDENKRLVVTFLPGDSDGVIVYRVKTHLSQGRTRNWYVEYRLACPIMLPRVVNELMNSSFEGRQEAEARPGGQHETSKQRQTVTYVRRDDKSFMGGMALHLESARGCGVVDGALGPHLPPLVREPMYSALVTIPACSVYGILGTPFRSILQEPPVQPSTGILDQVSERLDVVSEIIMYSFIKGTNFSVVRLSAARKSLSIAAIRRSPEKHFTSTTLLSL